MTFENHSYDGKQWVKDDYSEQVLIGAVWEKADGSVLPLVNTNLTFVRKKLHTITIKIADNSVSNGLSLKHEDGVLLPGDNTTLNSGDGIDTPVNPAP